MEQVKMPPPEEHPRLAGLVSHKSDTPIQPDTKA